MRDEVNHHEKIREIFQLKIRNFSSHTEISSSSAKSTLLFVVLEWAGLVFVTRARICLDVLGDWRQLPEVEEEPVFSPLLR